MAQPISTQPQIPGLSQPPHRVAPAIVVAAAVLGVIILLAALVLWFHYGTAFSLK
jgi:fructose-specific phosphotransferase system IIC component